MNIASDILSATSKIGVTSVKGHERTFSKFTPIGMVMYSKKLEAQIMAILDVLDAQDAEIKKLKEIVKV